MAYEDRLHGYTGPVGTMVDEDVLDTTPLYKTWGGMDSRGTPRSPDASKHIPLDYFASVCLVATGTYHDLS